MSTSNYSANGERIQSLVQGARNTITYNFHNSFQALSHGIEKIFSNILPQTPQDSPTLTELERKYLIEREHLNLKNKALEHAIASTGETLEIQRQFITIEKEDLSLRRAYFKDKLQLIRECHNDLVELRLKEFETNWEIHHSPLILSPKKTVEHFRRNPNYFWIVFSPVKISGRVNAFEDITSDIDYALARLISDSRSKVKPSSGEIPYPVQYLKVFKEPIEKLHAIDFRNWQSPISTLKMQSQITNEKILITITCPTSVDPIGESTRDYQTFIPPRPWKTIKLKINQSGRSDEESLLDIKALIILIHEIIVLYFSDLYLLNIDSFHRPKLFDFLDLSPNSTALNQWIKPFRDSLSEFQQYVQARAFQQSQETEAREGIYTGSASVISFSDFRWAPVAVACFGMMLLAFCSQQFLNPSPVVVKPLDESLYQPERYGTVQITNADFNPVANLWTEPDGIEKIGELTRDTQVTILSISSDQQWYRIQSEDGQMGWIHISSVIMEP